MKARTIRRPVYMQLANAQLLMRYLFVIFFIAEVKEELDNYVAKMWPDNIVKIVRAEKRLGLIRGRMAGADVSTGDVLVFLDAHCEVNEQWLETKFKCSTLIFIDLELFLKFILF